MDQIKRLKKNEINIKKDILTCSSEIFLSELINKKISDANLPEDIRIGAIIRKDKVIIPRSNFIFEKNDSVVFLAKREELKAVENIFSVGAI